MNSRIEELRLLIEKCNVEYYENDNSILEDSEYDALVRELFELEKNIPIEEAADSPTQKVGGNVAPGFKEIKHITTLLSLGNAFSDEDIRAFASKIEKEVGKVSYVVELKFDGLTIALTYKDGELITGATRGNGIVGEDVTENIKMVKSVPHTIENKASLTVRGEVFMKKSNFNELNRMNEITGDKIFSNPRNAASGSLRQLDSKITKERKLDAAIFNLEYIEDEQFSSHWESLNYLEKQGFLVSPNRKKFDNIEDVIKQIKYWGDNKEDLDFEIDGIVIKVDEIEKRELLSATSKVPKWAIAFKFPAEKKETKLIEVELQVGRTGAITPTAVLVPINISGSMVARASMHNFDYIKEKDIRINDTVVVRKAGEIIPEIVNVNVSLRDGSEEIIKIPTNCPSCNEPTHINEVDVAIRCINPNCPGINKRKIVHYVSKNAMDIGNLGESVVSVLYDKNIIKSVVDLYKLDKSELVQIERFGEKSVSNLLKAVENSKKQDLYRLIFGLGIEFIGLNSSKLLADYYENIQSLMNATKEELINIDEIGDKMADSIISYMSMPKNIEIINELLEFGVNGDKIKEENISSKLEGEKVVLTGTLPTLKRKEASELIEKNGGKVLSSVTKETTLVLSGEESGSKLDKAKKLGIRIIDENEFLEIIK